MPADSFAGQGAAGLSAELEFQILHPSGVPPLSFCSIFTELSQSCWPGPPARRLSVPLCQLAAPQGAGTPPGACSRGRGSVPVPLWGGVRSELWLWGGTL